MLGQGFRPDSVSILLCAALNHSQTIAGLLFAADYEAMALRSFAEGT
jgi:hypothetical protein